ncbi:MAG: hypothetical protein ACLGG0_09425 [Bacteriovoracia bacterium]
MKLLLFLALFSSLVFAEEQKKDQKKKEEKVEEVKPAPAAPAAPQKRLSIVYFSEALGPALAGGDGFVPDADKKGNPVPGIDGYNVWNQFAFRYKFDNGWEPFFNARFTSFFGNRDRLGSDDGVLRTEDQLVGVRKLIWSNKSGWSFFAQFGYRLPTSRLTIDQKWNGQVECFCILDWTPNKDWSFGAWVTPRFYIPSGDSTNERWRLYYAPYLRRRFLNDTTWFQAILEQELSHNEAKGDKSYNYSTRTLNSAYLGVEFMATDTLIFYPFVRSVNIAKFDPETIAVGSWIIWLAY